MENKEKDILIIRRSDDFYLWLGSRGAPRYLRLMDFLSPYVIALLGGYGAYFFFENYFPPDYQVYQSLIGAMSYWAGTIVDQESTIRVTSSINVFERQTGITSICVESAPFAPERPTQAYFDSFREKAINGASSIFSILVPPVGSGFGVARLFAGLYNEHVKAFHERKLREVLNT